MSLRVELAARVPEGTEAVVLPVTSDGERPGELARPGVAEYLAAQGFEGKPDQTAIVRAAAVTAGAGAIGTWAPDTWAPDLLVVGVGPAAEVDAGVLRRASAVALRAAKRRSVVASRLLEALPPGGDVPTAVQAVAEGAGLAAYRFTRYRTKPEPTAVEQLIVVSKGGKRAASAIERAQRIVEGVSLARDLVNVPGGEMTPISLAEAAVEVAEREDLQISVLDEHDIRAAGLGGLLGVNRGSNQPPRFIELGWEPENPRGTLAVVGKGITFDSGGLSIKPADSMMTMKDDMGGAAAVIGAFAAMGAVSPRCRVRGYIPATDNMSGGDATRPGDVLRIRNGTTVEVLNTDAEGRLVLADALSLASEAEPDAIVDLATLTGAVAIALGDRVTGLMGNDQRWIDQVREAAETAGERVWQLPLPDDYRSRIESDVADLRNMSKTRDGGTITAGLFLKEFVGEGIPWAHLDIAATAWWKDSSEGEMSRGGTGWGVRTILELARTFKAPARSRAALSRAR